MVFGTLESYLHIYIERSNIMSNTYKLKTCGFCGKQDRFTGKHCSHKCSNDHKRNEKIKKWLHGELDGRRGKTATAYWIKNYLIEIRGEKCEKCGWSETNLHTGKIPIELSHKNGDFTDNRIENLELICPNCYSLTSSYKGANKKSGRPRSKYYRGL